MSRLRLPSLAVAVLLAQPLAAQQPSAKKLYCWNEGGRRVCGDALPPSAVDAARTEIHGRSGLSGTRIGRALTPAERAALAAEQEQAAAQAEVSAEQRRRDLALVDSYNNEGELRQAYRIRYDLIDEALKTARLRLANQRNALVRLLQNAADSELAGRKVPPKLLQDILAQRLALVEAQDALRQRQSDRGALDAQLADALARYQATKGALQPAPIAPPAQP